MQHYSLMAKAATPTIAIIGNITTDQFHGPTPCTEFDVQKLINHLLFWGPPLEGAAGRKSVTPAGSSEHGVNLTDGDWKESSRRKPTVSSPPGANGLRGKA